MKICIISFFSFYVFVDVVPYYWGNDTSLYALTSIGLSNGEYGISNELMVKYQGDPFVPKQWAPTTKDVGIPIITPGWPFLGSIGYSLAGYNALFYLAPIIFVILLIVTERITTKLFGNVAGVLGLFFVASSEFVLWAGRNFNPDLIFPLFMLLGFFFTLKFIKTNKSSYLLLSSTFFALTTIFRMNGIIFFPIEILVVGIFLIKNFYSNKNPSENNSQSSFSNPNGLKTNSTTTHSFKKLNNPVQIISNLGSLFLPWIIIAVFFMIFNNYYFGDPFTNYLSERDLLNTTSDKNFVQSFFIFDYDRFEYIKYYSVGILPHSFNLFFQDALNDNFRFINNNWISIVIFLFFIVSATISFFTKRNRTEIGIILLLIFGLLLFYSSNYITTPYSEVSFRSLDIQFRYMVPNIILFSILFGFILSSVWDFKKDTYKKIHDKISLNKVQLPLLISILLLVSSFMLVSAPYIKFNDPDFEFFVPPEMENPFSWTKQELPENSIMIFPTGRDMYQYNHGIPFYTNNGWVANDFHSNMIKDDDIEIIKTEMERNYSFFSFKAKKTGDPWFFRYLEDKHNLVLQDYNRTFCKLVDVSSKNDIGESSDDVCYGLDEKFVPKFP